VTVNPMPDWCPVALGDLAGPGSVFSDGDWVESKDQDPNGDVRLIQLADIGDGEYTSKSKRFLTSTKATELRCTYLKAGDVLVARMPDPLGRACVFPGDPKKSVTVVDVCILRLDADVEHRWLMHTINSPAIRGQIASYQSGSTRKRISRRNLARVVLQLPPRVEQRAIVAKVESILTELDDGVAQLEIVKKQLNRYRQAVLKAAFEGKLTEEWRVRRLAEGGATPDGAAVLDQSREELQAQYEGRLLEWEEAVSEWNAAGGQDSGRKKPRKPAKPTEPAPLTSDELEALPALPEGWAWARMGLLCEVSGGLTKNAKRNALPLRLPYLRVANVYAGRLELDVIKEIGVTEAERDKTLLRAEDLLFVEGNGSADQIGRVARWTGVVDPCLHQNHLIRARPASRLSSAFLMHWFLSPLGRARVVREASSTSGLHTLSIGKVSALVAPVAGPEEQVEIVSEIESRLSVVEQLEHAMGEALQQATGLRQSVLNRAFEGCLLTQSELAVVRADPAYEPADRLLARILDRREKAANGTARRGRGSKSATRTKRAIRLPKGERYRQAAVASYAVNRLGHLPTFGRVQQMKFLYLVPHVLEQESHIHAERQAAGPLDPAIHKVESLAAKQEWFRARKSGNRTVYEPGSKIEDGCAVAEAAFGDQKSRVDWLLDRFAKFDTEQAELLATTFAVWNDYLIDGTDPSDAEVIAGVHGWHSEKAGKFPEDRIAECIRWMRKQKFVPTGTGPKTEAIGGGA
jgi:type I restriction enzyme S subunit